MLPLEKMPILDLLFKVNWYQVFVPSIPIAELVVRGSLVYLMLFALLRFLPNRQVGAVGIADLLVVVLFVDAAQNAMATNYTSVTDGAILVLTIILWSYALNWLGYRFRGFQRFLNRAPLPLVSNGRLLRFNMERELLTQNELMSLLRKQGVQRLDDVKVAFMEPDGSLSVIIRNSKSKVLPAEKAA